MSMKTNENRLVRMAVQGQVIHPRCYGWEVTHDGSAAFLPAVGGITYNIKVGDPAFGWVADHPEPGVSFTASRDRLKDNPNKAFNAFSCIGNRVRLISGSAAGKTGVVTGHHGGVEHVMVDFSDDVLKKMTEDDKILIECFGTGLVVEEVPDVMIFALDPSLFKKWGVKPAQKNSLQIPVTAEIPPELMGAGVGEFENYKGDFDVQTQDEKTIRKVGLDQLRLGDFVALKDQDCRYGVGYRKGSMSIGIVVHGDSRLSGHGPGVRVVMSGKASQLRPVISDTANLAQCLGIGRYRGTRRSG